MPGSVNDARFGSRTMALCLVTTRAGLDTLCNVVLASILAGTSTSNGCWLAVFGDSSMKRTSHSG
jgi:hypothetical protein